MSKKRGKFIVFEGIDGCGKSTQIKKFVNYLFSKDKHNHINLTRNPYRDSNIRGILKEDDDAMSQAEKLTELFIKDREMQAEELIKPHVELGHFVVCDRYKLSTVAYQASQGQDINELIEKQEHLPKADITFIFDVPVKVAAERMKRESKRNEHKFEADLGFLEDVRKNYLKSKDLVNERIFVIDASKDIESIFNNIKEIFEREVLSENERIS